MSITISDDLRSELDELYKSILKNELILDAVRNVVDSGVLSETDEEYLALALSPSQLTAKDFETLGFANEDADPLRLSTKKRNIPALKGLVEKELDVTCNLIKQLETTTSSINRRRIDVPSLVDNIQSTAGQLSNKAHDLYKQAKIVAKLHAVHSSAPLQESLETLNCETEEALLSSKSLEESILDDMYGGASTEYLETVADKLKTELADLTLKCDIERAQLDLYEDHREELLVAAKELSRIDEEIHLKSAALRAFSLDNTAPT